MTSSASIPTAAVIWDFGGVLSSSPFQAFGRFERERGLPADFLRSVNATNPLDNAWARLERDDCTLAQFDTLFAAESQALGHRVGGAEVLALLEGTLRPEMVEALRAIKVGIVAYKSTHVLASLEEITQQLDDQFNVLNFMKASPFIKPILKRVDDLEKRLLIIQDTLEGWIKCQRSWMYLEPIFASDDIKKKMALEHQKFVAIDRNFRQTMEHFNKDPHLWDNIDSDKMKNDFDQNNKYILYLRSKIFICLSLNNSISYLISEFLH